MQFAIPVALCDPAELTAIARTAYDDVAKI